MKRKRVMDKKGNLDELLVPNTHFSLLHHNPFYKVIILIDFEKSITDTILPFFIWEIVFRDHTLSLCVHCIEILTFK